MSASFPNGKAFLRTLIVMSLLFLAGLFWFMTAPDNPMEWQVSNHHSQDYKPRYFDKSR